MTWGCSPDLKRLELMVNARPSCFGEGHPTRKTRICAEARSTAPELHGSNRLAVAHSWRKAVMGSRREARRAGRKLAPKPMAARMSTVSARVSGSLRLGRQIADRNARTPSFVFCRRA
jgi:hypothetical protein